jgi:hypothetical protein
LPAWPARPRLRQRTPGKKRKPRSANTTTATPWSTCHYDLVIGDEAWDVDYHYHENPELKRQPFVFLTDFVGCLPMNRDDERECHLCADRNAEMIEQVARYPYLRDRAIFVGNRDDVVEDPFGPGLPGIREWTDKNFCYCGYCLRSTPRRSPTPSGCAPGTATARTRRSPSPRWAAPRSAGRCSSASPRPSRA